MIYENGIYSPFGPTVGINEISTENLNSFKEIAKTVRDQNLPDAGQYLAGIIEEQYEITSVVNKSMMDEIFELCNEYLNAQMPGQYPLSCDGLWMNIQKPLEVNPPHEHTGVVSFVLYVNSELTLEDCRNNAYDKKVRDISSQKEQIGGILELRYGSYNLLNNHTFNIFPQEGKIIFFPSWLQHMVMPFFKEGKERISVAGNISFYQE